MLPGGEGQAPCADLLCSTGLGLLFAVGFICFRVFCLSANRCQYISEACRGFQVWFFFSLPLVVVVVVEYVVMCEPAGWQ